MKIGEQLSVFCQFRQENNSLVHGDTKGDVENWMGLYFRGKTDRNEEILAMGVWGIDNGTLLSL